MVKEKALVLSQRHSSSVWYLVPATVRLSSVNEFRVPCNSHLGPTFIHACERAKAQPQESNLEPSPSRGAALPLS